MRLNPKEEYLINKSKETIIKDCLEYCSVNTKIESAHSLLRNGYSIEKVVELTKLPREVILNSK